MKYIAILITMLMSTAVLAQVENPVEKPRKVASSFQKTYIPQGFDSNDRVEIVAEGTFPNSCYRPGPATASIDHNTKTIKLSSEAYLYPGQQCIQMIVQYSNVISLGVLGRGNYKVVQGQENRQMGLLNVKGAQIANPDDHIYAPINQALLTKVNGKITLTLAGTFTNNCMELERVKVKNQGDVIVVQPIAYFESDDFCEDGHFPFKYEREVTENIDSGRYLLHVRSINGKSINNLVDIN